MALRRDLFGETVVRFGAGKRCFGGILGCLVEAV
jgi:hypothetical protein